MSTTQRAELKKIRTFPSLIAYLRDEMGWPIDSADFDDLTFEYEPEELGIDSASAAKIEEIRRLRPLSINQPWGIFFVKFEPKKLPVVALRRILNRVVLKKRASANKSERSAWAADDLLFVSNYGAGDSRQITFAHFSHEGESSGLPTLKVLGWDKADTALHLDDIAEKLTDNLAWPADDEDVEAWRKKWRSAFTLRHGEVITTSKALALRLAELARLIRDRISTVIEIETDDGPVTKLMKAFQKALIHDLDPAGFADMYAQTVAYGLLSARITDPKSSTTEDFAAHMRTNPFLRDLMEAFLHVGGPRGEAGAESGLDFDELGVGDVVGLLDGANMEAVVRDFGDRNPEEDPVIHFYESFLTEYDAKKRMQRGVFYTPRPVVSYIVHSVHELLQTEFGLTDGLADTATWGDMAKRDASLTIPDGLKPTDGFVTVLDPATGTGTFLVEVIDVIHDTLVQRWNHEGHGEKMILDLWNNYVSNQLLPRLHGYELLMAPYAIAHLKISLKLHETGYRFETDERARIYLTNALEPAHDFSGQLELAIPALADETHAVNAIKRDKRFTVVIGNPPYANFGQLNKIPFILDLLEDYKRGLDEKKLNLDDDFIKFVRLCQHLVAEADVGIAALITNSVFLDGITHRRMRESLMTEYSRIDILDLHGNSKRGEQSPDGSADENVFEIQQGVAISICCRLGEAAKPVVARSDAWGRREAKYAYLASNDCASTDWTTLDPLAPHYFFGLQGDDRNRTEYESGWSTKAIFPINSDGMQTKRDRLTVHFTEMELLEAKDDLTSLTDSELRDKYGLPDDGRDWTVDRARKDVEEHAGQVVLVEYRPFDWRYTFYTGKSKGFIAYPRDAVSAHLVTHESLGLAVNRFIKLDYVAHFLAVKSVVDTHLLETANSCLNVSPLYLVGGRNGELTLSGAKRPNLSRDFLQALAARLDLPTGGDHELPEGVEPEDIFHYAYAVFGSPDYRERYASFLKVDFPRLPLPGGLALFSALASLGSELVALHLLESPTLDRSTATYSGPPDPEVGRVGWSNDTVWLDAAGAKKGRPAKPGTIGFRGVPEDVWNFQIGGYRVCEKWLKDRKGRRLSVEEIAAYHKIIVALGETINLTEQIDEVIGEYGGWPDAFLMREGKAEIQG